MMMMMMMVMTMNDNTLLFFVHSFMEMNSRNDFLVSLSLSSFLSLFSPRFSDSVWTPFADQQRNHVTNENEWISCLSLSFLLQQVIKRMSKSKAKQRLEALANWKVSLSFSFSPLDSHQSDTHSLLELPLKQFASQSSCFSSLLHYQSFSA